MVRGQPATGPRHRGEGRFGPPCLRVQRDNSFPDCCLIRLTPLAFTCDLDPGAVDQQVQRPGGTVIGDVNLERSTGLRGPTGATVLSHTGGGTAC